MCVSKVNLLSFQINPNRSIVMAWRSKKQAFTFSFITLNNLRLLCTRCYSRYIYTRNFLYSNCLSHLRSNHSCIPLKVPHCSQSGSVDHLCGDQTSCSFLPVQLARCGELLEDSAPLTPHIYICNYNIIISNHLIYLQQINQSSPSFTELLYSIYVANNL